ncbi:hypothetical protein, partial [uncultured Caballeronia sp.]|uniref:hypothetical protein n=1 Tax=uncultured Caballeronia sp. TaxID=1827198 RepID=UPI0035C98B67
LSVIAAHQELSVWYPDHISRTNPSIANGEGCRSSELLKNGKRRPSTDSAHRDGSNCNLVLEISNHDCLHNLISSVVIAPSPGLSDASSKIGCLRWPIPLDQGPMVSNLISALMFPYQPVLLVSMLRQDRFRRQSVDL